MPAKTKRSNRVRKNKTRRGGVLKTALAAAALATGAQAKSALGQGVTPRGVGPYGMNRPAPSRNVAGLNVIPENIIHPDPYTAKFAYPKGKFFPNQLADFPGWPKPGPGFVESNNLWLNTHHKKGTRHTSEPEIQTWNPYLRGDPEEVVDYYEGFSNADKKARMNTEGDGGKVKRKNTPMWKAAMRHSAKLPPRLMNKHESDLKWTQWAEEGRELGMNIPLNDPRVAESPNPNWANVPEASPEWYLSEQLYHHGELPKMSLGKPKMKGNKPFPENWKNSHLGKK
jgi:hypothetical protein